MRSAREIIESIQERSYRDSGVEPADIRSYALASVRNTIARLERGEVEGELDAVKDFYARLQEIAARDDLTRFQDPITIDKILECWRLIQEGNPEETLGIEDPQTHPDNVVLATAPTGNLNAMSIQGDNRSRGILFEVDLHAWALLFGILIIELLVTETETRVEVRHPRDPSAFIGKDEVLDRFAEALVRTAMSGTVEWALDGLNVPSSPELKKLSDLVMTGFLTFVAGHEMAHLIRRHHNMAERKGYWIPKDLGETWNKYQTVYADRHPGLTSDAVVKKVMRQGIELEADYYGYLYTANTLRLHPSMQMLIQNDDGVEAADPRMNAMFVEIGVRAFFWSMEYLERTVRTLHTGHDGSSLGIFSTDFDVQDIVCRDSHPSPLTRIKWSNGMFDVARPANDLLQILFERVWERGYPNIRALHGDGARPHPKWIRADSEVALQLGFL